MRIAAISDIHGNLGALDAVLADIGRRKVDHLVNLGDLLSGPLQPRETAARLMDLRIPTICGNHERQLLAEDREGMADSDRYAAEAITEAQREWLAALPATLWLNDDVFLCHATPSSDVACFVEDIRDGEFVGAASSAIASRVGDCRARVILCGHTHIPRLTTIGNGQLIVNPGSVGLQAYHGHHPIPHRLEMGAPHARYAILEKTIRGWVAELLAVPYDWEAAATRAERHGRLDWATALRTGCLPTSAGQTSRDA